MLDLVVEGNAYLDGNLNKCCIGIESGKIIAIKKILKGDRILDFGDKLILPAGIDVHVHFRDPGSTYKEDFGTGTEAAAFGGISCALDMPNTNPPIISFDSLQEKLISIKKKACIDFGLYSSITPKSNIQSIAQLCSAFKIYLGSTTGKLLYSDDRSLASSLLKINRCGKLPAIHAESERIIRREITRSKPAKNLHDHLCNRPNKAESRAISRLLTLAQSWEELNEKYQRFDPGRPINDFINMKKRLHLCHVSTLEGLRLIRRYKKSIGESSQQNAVTVTAEVTPHHLILNEHFDGGVLGKVNPPLRRPEDQSALWSGIADGTIDILASDHAPHTYEDKSQEFALAPAGLPGVETMLPLMLSYVKHNNLSISTLIRAISSNPGSIFSLPKGRLSIGYDGDLIVVDFYKEERIRARNLHSKCGWTPYENKDAVFPILTVVRGNITIKNGNLEVDPGIGKFYN